jgi:hypothetical protein
MDDLPWLEGYAGGSIDEFLALEGRYRTDSIIVALHQMVGLKDEDLLSGSERAVLAVGELENQINNGGFSQFFENSPEHVGEVVEALKKIGDTQAADITSKAIQTLGVEGAVTAGAVAGAISRQDHARDVKLDQLDQAYIQQVGDLAEKLLDYAKRNRRDFAFG